MGNNCRFALICKFFEPRMINCRFIGICKFFELVVDEPTKLREEIFGPKKKKAGRPKKNKPGVRIKGLTTSEEDIKHIRGLLKSERRRGRLNEEQVAALDEIGKTRYNALTDGQKEQLVNIYYGPRRKKNG